MKRSILALAAFLLLAMGVLPASAATPVATPEGYAHPEWLVDAAWLNQHLHDPNLAVVALTPPENFSAGHIDGAIQVDWPDLALSESAKIAEWQEQMGSLLTKLGIERSDTVIVYDGGTLYAPRLWWILYQLGHRDMRILNGGLPAWSAAGLPLTKGGFTPVPAAERYQGEPNEEAIATVDQVAASLEDPGTVLVDARTPDEYATGHIPGAVLFPFTDVASPNAPHLWKPADELSQELAKLGVTPDKHVIPYCSTGVRSATLYFTLRLIGYDAVSLFSGSYQEWTADPSRPIERS